MKTFKLLSDLKKAIEADVKQKISSTLENEVADTTKKIVQKHIQDDVYGAGHPIYYNRRYHNGGMIDENNLESNVKDGVLTVTNITKMNPIKGEKWLNDGYTLSHLIIDGWNTPTEWYNSPRPYMENANDELENNNEIQKAIDNGLKRQGLRRVK